MTRTPTQLTTRLSALTGPEDQPARDALILEALSDTSPAVREVAVAWAARCLDPVVLLPRVAEESDAVLRNAALAALERQGPFAVEAVAGKTADPDPDVAMFTCQVLGGIGHPHGVPALLVALERPEINVVQAAVEALGRIRSREAVAPLMELLNREPWLQLAAVDALGAIGDRTALGLLMGLVPDGFVAIPALEAIRRIGDPEPIDRLLPLLLDPDRAALRLPLTRTIGGLVPAAQAGTEYPAVGRAIDHNHGDGSLWRFLADRLTGEEDEGDLVPDPLGDDRIRVRGGGVTVRAAGAIVLAFRVESLIPLVLRQAADKDWAGWIAPVARRFTLDRTPASTALLAHVDPAVRTGALRVLPPGVLGVERILPLLDDPDATVRLAAIETLGALADERAAERLTQRLKGDADGEREAAARALAQLPEAAVARALAPWVDAPVSDPTLPAVLLVLAARRVEAWDERILKIAQSGAGPLRRSALKAASRIPGSGAEVVLLRALADRDQAVQVEALELLAAHAGARVVRTLIALLGVADSLRYHVIRALGRIGALEAAAPLETLFTTAPLHEQLEIIAALERLGNPRSRAFMSGCLRHPHAEIQRSGARGLASLATADDLTELDHLAGSSDWVLRSEAARGFGRLALPEGRPRLLDLVRDLEPVVSRTARAALGSWP